MPTRQKQQQQQQKRHSFVHSVLGLASIFGARTENSRNVNNDLRPYVKMSLKSGQVIEALCDSGAMLSCISEETFFNLRNQILLPPGDRKSIKGISGRVLPIVGRTIVEFQTQGRWFSADFSVIRGLNTAPILGADWLSSAGVLVKCGDGQTPIKLEAAVAQVGNCKKSNKIRDIVGDKSDFQNLKQESLFQGSRFKYWKSNLYEIFVNLCSNEELSSKHAKEKFFITSNEEMTIISGKTKILRGKAVDFYGNRPNSASGILENFQFLKSDVFLIPSRVEFDENGNFSIAVTNQTGGTIQINRNAKLGYFVELERFHVQIVDAAFVEFLRRNEKEAAGTYNTQLSIPSDVKNTIIEQAVSLQGLCESESSELKLLLREFHDIIARDAYDIGKAKDFEHRVLKKTNAPIFKKQFPLPETYQDFVNEYVTKLLKMGVITESTSPYNTPIFVVPKKAEPGAPATARLRLVQDYRAINEAVFEDKYTIREVNSCISEIGKRESKRFSALDLLSGFWQMPLHEDSQLMTGFTVTGRGHFHWTRTPMGLNSAPAGFSRLIDSVFKSLPGVITYVDDILVHSRNFSEHILELRGAFERLRENNLKLNLLKCSFGKFETSYLGFRLTQNGVIPGKDKARAIKEFKEPEDIKSVRSFIGMANYFRCHVKGFAQISAHLTALLRKDSKWKGGPLPDKAKQAFLRLKQILASEPVMAYPRTGSPFILTTDAATGTEEVAGGFGAVLSQIQNGKEVVIAYASRTMRSHERNYSPFLAEMAASLFGIDEFCNHLKGRRFTLRSDHKPLEKLSSIHKKTLNRLQEAMNEYDFKIEYLPGKANSVADALSRSPVDVSELTLTDCETHVLQMTDPFLANLYKFVKFGFKSKDILEQRKFERIKNRIVIRDDIIFVKNQVFDKIIEQFWVPLKLRKDLIDGYHKSLMGGHMSIDRTIWKIQRKYFWPKMVTEIENRILNCRSCQFSKLKTKDRKPIELTIPKQPDGPNERIHMDLYGPLRNSETDNRWILTISDAFSKYAVLVPIPNKEAGTVARAFFEKWICVFGEPKQIVTDQGLEFCNSILKNLCNLFGIEKSRTSGYYPQGNAKAETFNREIKKYITCFVENKTLEWEKYLAPLAFSYNTAIHKATLQTPFFLTYLHDPEMSFDIQRPKPIYRHDYAIEAYQNMKDCFDLVKRNNEIFSEKAKIYFDKKTLQKNFKINDKVLIYFPPRVLNGNQKFIQPYKGPFIVTKIVSKCNIIVKNEKNKEMLVHVNRAKKYFEEEENIDFYEKDTNFETFQKEQISDKVRKAIKRNILKSQQPTDTENKVVKRNFHIILPRTNDNSTNSRTIKTNFESDGNSQTENQSQVHHDSRSSDQTDDDLDDFQSFGRSELDSEPELLDSSDSDSDEEEEDADQTVLNNDNLGSNDQPLTSTPEVHRERGGISTRSRNPNLNIDLTLPRLPLESKRKKK